MDPLQTNENKNLSSIPEALLQSDQASDVTGYSNPMPLPASLEKYRAYLPSKRIMMAFGAIVIIGLGYIIILKIPTMFRVVKNIFTSQNSLPVSKTPVSVVQNEADSDSDGIPDWQEALFNLDPSDADSDNDGVLDSLPSDLQALAENPDIVTPGDKITLSIIADLQKDPKEYTQEEVAQKVTDKIMETAEGIENQFQKYTIKDIQTVDDTREEIQKYQKNINVLQKRIVLNEQSLQNAHTIALSGQGFSTVPATVLGYPDIVKQLLTMTPPRIVAEQHIKLVNGLSSLHQMLQKSNTDNAFITQTDPYVRFMIVQKNVNAINKSLANIKLLAV